VLQAVLPPTGPDRWPYAGGLRTAPALRRIGVAAAILVHASIIFVALRIAIPPPATSPDLPGVPIIFARPSPAVAVPFAAVALPAPAQRQVATALALRVAPRKLTAPEAPARPERPAPAVATAPTAVPQATPKATLHAENVAELGAFEARLDAAVRAAAAMPEAARRQHRTGGARVGFRYRDGAVDDVRIIESSQSRLLDDAAMKAVRVAHYPAPPAGIRGRMLELLVRIDFRMDG
jgi:protein TonB